MIRLLMTLKSGFKNSFNFSFQNKGPVLLTFVLILLIYPGYSQSRQDQYLVVLSLDAFRWDYPDKAHTPNLDRIAQNGVKAKSLKPSFPSLTFPNHYSMATGLYPDHHGIVNNRFYAPEFDEYYSIGDRSKVEDGKFYGGEPIWVTAENQGLKTGIFYWVGSEAPVKGVYSTNWKKYDHDFPFKQRADTVISWLKLPDEQRPRLIMWYIAEPDGAGHDFGPDSPELVKMVESLDSIVGYFLNEMDKLPVKDKINLIVTSDHGMGTISADRVILLEELIPHHWVEEIEGSNPVFSIDAKEQFIDSVYFILSKVKHLSVWKHGQVPQRLNYGNNPRTLDIIVLADSSWTLTYKSKRDYGKGAHGYDNNNTDMHAIFYAFGPMFKKGFKQGTFENVNLYALMAGILGLRPAFTDGDLKNVEDMLIKE